MYAEVSLVCVCVCVCVCMFMCVSVYVCVSLCVYACVSVYALANVRMPLLATSVQEQLETGNKSTADVLDQAPQVNTLLLLLLVLKSCKVSVVCLFA